jgi:lipoic acid synthetase
MFDSPRRPEWLRQKPVDFNELLNMQKLMRGLKLHTVCDSAQCPNRTECFSQHTVTFLILGDVCTRNCTFCNVTKGRPLTVDPWEPDHVVEAVNKLGIRYAVITSVTRDDLPDGGASQFARTVQAIRKYDPDIITEILIPDFQGSVDALRIVVDSSPCVLGHNVETVPRLYSRVRSKADYRRSLEVLKQAKQIKDKLLTKSGLMLGLGESREEVIEVLSDLKKAGCDIITIGQYLQPSLKHEPVSKFVCPEDFMEYETVGKRMGFRQVISGPMVRSSFHAREIYNSAIN